MVDLDVLAPELIADPYPAYEQVRAAGRCVHSDRVGAWMVTGYDDAVTILRDPNRFSSSIMAGEEFGPWYGGAATMLGTDPPEHSRLRSVVQRLFTARATAGRAARVEAIVAGLLTDKVAGPLSAGRPVELVGPVLEPLPVLVLLDLLGFPADEVDAVTRWTTEMALGSVAALHTNTGPAAARDHQRALAAGAELAAYVREHVARRRADPAGDVVGQLLAAAGTGAVSPAEVVATCVLLLLAGIETSVKALGNAVALLGRHHDQQRRLSADPSLVGSAVEEVLRMSGPTQFDPRAVAVDTVLAGVPLQHGEVVWILTPAANRDPDRFPRPNHFDVGRSPNPHLGFGHGAHLCLGAPLARLEIRVLLTQLLRSAPSYDVSDVDYGRGFFVRGPVRLNLVPAAG